MIELGISLYPEQETLEAMENYIKLASSYGFTKIFSSMFSVPGQPEDVKNLFKTLCKIAHNANMEVCVDVNTQMFSVYGAAADDLSVFKEIGVDEIRMDMCYGDERDTILVNNKEHIRVQFSAFMIEVISPLLKKVEDTSKITMCHNFYPQRYTGVSISDFIKINQFWKHENINVSAFITSNSSQAHGPWPVNDGLPTVEIHRYQPISFQVREMIAAGVNTIYFGNAFATEAELKEASEAVTMLWINNINNTKLNAMNSSLMAKYGKKVIAFHIIPEANLSEIEKTILFTFDKHIDFGDSNEFMLRSRMPRIAYGKQEIPPRACDKKVFTRGDVLIVNDNLKYYRGELQICRSEMENDGQRNLVGYLNENECRLMDYIDTTSIFKFTS